MNARFRADHRLTPDSHSRSFLPGTRKSRVAPGFRDLDAAQLGGWEDDGVQFDDPDDRGGADAESLNEARAAFAAAHPPLTRDHDG